MRRGDWGDRVDWGRDLRPPVVGQDRPDFGPNQVRSPEELVAGMVVVHHGASSAERTEITSAPFQKADGGWWISGISEHEKRTSPENPKEMEMSLADRGVVAYSNGMWHLYNWLERVDTS